MFDFKVDTPQMVTKIRFILDLLDKGSRSKLLSLTLFLSLLAILDFAAVFFIGLMTMMAMGNLESSRLPTQVMFFVNHIAGTTENSQTATLRIALIAMALLLLRTIFSIRLTRKTFVILSAKGADLSFYLLSKLLSSPPSKLLAQNQQAIVHTLTYGVRSAVIDVIGPLMILISDFVLLGILFCGLAFIDFWLAATSILFFTSIACYLYFLLHVKAGKLGKLNSELEISSNKKIFEILKNFKQIYAGDRIDYNRDQYHRLRLNFAAVDASRSFMPYIGKYVIESAVVFGTLLMAGTQFMFNSPGEALANLSIFVAASTRVAPAILRVQQNFVQINGGIGISHKLIELSKIVYPYEFKSQIREEIDFTHQGFSSSLSLRSINFKYEDSKSLSITDLNLEINEGEFVLILGPSGAGKTTLVDLILGIIEPNSGTVKISGLSPRVAIAKWPGAISYMSQDPFVFDGTIYENITLGYNFSEKKDVSEMLNFAALKSTVDALPDGLEYRVGEDGVFLSGGQKQRLGLARAKFSNPKVLVLDESTSALDWLVEGDVVSAINKLKGSVTTILIAHKVSQNFLPDKVVYIDKGKVKFDGTLENCMELFPELLITPNEEL